jgi:hypothetical protein
LAPDSTGDAPAPMTTSDKAPTPEQARRLKAQELATEAFREVERRYARGTPFDEAKQAVLDARIPEILAQDGEEVADSVIHLVMRVSLTGVHPDLRRRHRDRRWKHLAEVHAAAGGTPPSGLERTLFDWFGYVPRRMRR